MADAGLGFFIMRKDDPITYAEFTLDGSMIAYARNILNKDLAPLQDMYQDQWLKLWWQERSIPIEQDNIQRFLKQNGYSIPSDFLIKNLGLSLTDYYWVKPVDSDLTWKDVNLFDNDFKENLFNWNRDQNDLDQNIDEAGVAHYSPNGSLQGTLEKTWVINNGERFLVKGNHSEKFDESINELIACEIHKRQGWENYCDYHLLHIKHRDYQYGCYSKLFTSQKQELVSAWSLFTNEKKRNDVSNYEHLLKMCKKYGMDVDSVRHDLEYQILVDFVMSAHDRHLNNIAFLRNADSLKFTGMAPIYDSGGSMFAGRFIPVNKKELMNLRTNSFVARELDLISLVKDPFLIDLDKLPDSSFIRHMYEQDQHMKEKDINNIAHWYECKIDMCRNLQLGRSMVKDTYFFSGSKQNCKQSARRRKCNGGE